MRLRKIFVLLFVLVVSVIDLRGQELTPPRLSPAPKKVAKIGLVLSGGGARGIAHIGVLDWFEKHRIPVDAISGTSMGGLVGATYSIGMPPAEIRTLLKGINWSELLSSGPTYQQISFRRKEDRNSYQIGIELGLRNGVGLPLGLSSAHFIGLLLDRLTLPYADLASFDELPIPYRCVATDFLAAQPVVLKDGPLGTAIRATMSIPGVFPPVERDGKVLVDGGLLNNIPTNVIKELAPDLIIVIDVGTPLGDLKSISSLSGILQQSIAVMTIDNDRRNLSLADIIIAPNLGDQSLLDFSAIDKMIELGYQAAEEKKFLLEKFALDETEWQEYMLRRRSRRRTEIPIPTALKIIGVGPREEINLRNRLADFVGQPLATPELEAELTRITGGGRYESLGYGITTSDLAPTHKTLEIRVKEKIHAPPILNSSLEIDGSEVSEINFTIGGRITFYDIWKSGSEWRSDLKLGFNNIFFTEYYLPLNGKGFFIAPSASYRRERRGLFFDDARAAEYRIERYGIGIDLGFTARQHEFRIGYDLGSLNANVRSGNPLLPTIDGPSRFARLRWAFDNQDSATVPTRGLRLTTDLRWHFASPGAPQDYPQAEIKASIFHPVSNRGLIFVAGAGGTSFNYITGPAQQFTLGGPFRLGAYDRDEFRGANYALLTTGYLHQISQLPPLLGGKIYLGGWYDSGSAWGGPTANILNNRFRSAISSGLVVNTILGPLSLIGSFGEGGRGKIYFALGRFF